MRQYFRYLYYRYVLCAKNEHQWELIGNLRDLFNLTTPLVIHCSICDKTGYSASKISGGCFYFENYKRFLYITSRLGYDFEDNR